VDSRSRRVRSTHALSSIRRILLLGLAVRHQWAWKVSVQSQHLMMSATLSVSFFLSLGTLNCERVEIWQIDRHQELGQVMDVAERTGGKPGKRVKERKVVVKGQESSELSRRAHPTFMKASTKTHASRKDNNKLFEVQETRRLLNNTSPGSHGCRFKLSNKLHGHVNYQIRKKDPGLFEPRRLFI